MKPKKIIVNRFWNRKSHCDILGWEGGGLACDVLKFAFLHQVFHNQESF